MKKRTSTHRDGDYDAHAPHVYGAALAAAGDRRVAEQAACEALAGGGTRETMVERALLVAVRRSAGGPFAVFAADDRDAIVLARLAHYRADRIALVLGIDPSEAKLRLTRGLRAAADAADAIPARPGVTGVVQRMPRLRRDCENAASPVRAARAS